MKCFCVIRLRLRLFAFFIGMLFIAISNRTRAEETADSFIVRIIIPSTAFNDTAMQSIVLAVESHLTDFSNVVVEQIPDDGTFGTPDEMDIVIQALSGASVLAVLRCIPEKERFRVFIYLADAENRGNPSERGIEVVGADGTGETLGVILHASLGALLNRPAPRPPKTSEVAQVAEHSDSDPPEMQQNEIPEQSPKDGWFLLEAAYDVRFPVLRHPLHSAYVAVGFRVLEYVRLHLSYTITSLYFVESEPLRLEIRRHPVGIGTVFFLQKRFLEPRFRFSVIIDYASNYLSIRDNTYTSDAPSGRMQLSLQSCVELGIELYKKVHVYFGVGFDAFLLRPKYIVKQADAKITVFEPLRVQPMAAVGLSGGFF